MIDNNKNDDDFAADSFEDDSFADFEGGGNGTLGDMFRNNPMVKIGVVLGGFAVIVGGIILFGGEKQDLPVSAVRSSPTEVVETPGSKEVSETYKKAVEESNVQAVEQAVRQGGSALPVPIAPPVGRVQTTDVQQTGEDPLERWRRIQEERQRRETVVDRNQVQQQQQMQQRAEEANTDAVNKLADAMSRQMESVLDKVQPVSAQIKRITDPRFLEEEEQRAIRQAQAASRQDNLPTPLDIILPAGTLEYAQLLTEANSDAQGPILAQIVSGPLSGSRLLGSFSVEEELLVLNFNTVVIDGISHPIEAIALDPKTTTPGLVTHIDRRYFRRVILPAAAAFVEGMGSAIADSGSTTVSVEGDTVAQSEEDLDVREEFFKGVEKAAEELGDIFDRNGQNIQPLIRVEAGTPMGILFVQPVTEQPVQSVQAVQQ